METLCQTPPLSHYLLRLRCSKKTTPSFSPSLPTPLCCQSQLYVSLPTHFSSKLIYLLPSGQKCLLRPWSASVLTTDSTQPLSVVTLGPPPDIPPASHPIPPTDPALWHTGLLLPTMSLTQHPYSVPTKTSPLLSSRCSAWSPSHFCRHRASVHLRNRTSPILPRIPPSELSECVRPQDTTLQESERHSHFLFFPRILQICLEGVIKSQNLPSTLQNCLPHRIYSMHGFASLVYHQATLASSKSLTSTSTHNY